MATHTHETKAEHDAKYTDPALRERLKNEIMAADKGGAPGQWSARKSQLLVHEYEKAGGGYTSAERDETQQHLEEWTEQNWQTATGDARARHDGTTDRYLPAEAWEHLTPAQKRATDAKKHAGTAEGHQHVPNTAAAREAREAAEHHP